MLGPVLYTIFTSDIPETENVLITTYADDTALLSSSQSPVEETNLVQEELNKIQSWLDCWRTKVKNS